MRALMVALFILCGQALASADSYTITTDVQQEKALAHVVTRVNAERATRTPPLPAVPQQEYLQNVVNSVFTNYQHQKEEAEAAQALALKARYNALSLAQQAAVDAILNNPSPPQGP